jgi:hypothetical protein
VSFQYVQYGDIDGVNILVTLKGILKILSLDDCPETLRRLLEEY